MHLDLDLEFKGEEFNVKSNSGGVSFKLSVRGDNQSQPAPLEVFLSSLASCVGIFAVKYLKGAKIDFSRLNINIKSDLVKRDSLKLDNIVLFVDTDAKLEDRRDAFLRFLHKCPIHNTILNTDKIEFDLK